MSIAVSVQNLRVDYPTRNGTVRALEDMAFEIHEGEMVAIIGRSGSGKSTLLRVLCGLQAPSAGTVDIADHRLDARTTPVREFYRDVGLVFQNYGLVPQLDPVRNVLCGRLYDYDRSGGLLRFRPEERAEAVRLLEELGLGARLNVRCSRLSGGEQQRVGIARLLHQDPRVLLLDEPIASLDVHWSEKTIERLRHTRAGQATTLVVMHDLAMVRKYADRVLLVHDGRLVFDGPPEEGCRRLETLEVPGSERTCGRDGTLETSAGLNASGAARHAAARLDQTTAPPGTPPAPAPAMPLHEKLLSRSSFYVLVALAAIAAYVWAAMGVNFSASKLFGSRANTVDFLSRMLPPDLSVTPTIGASLVETLQMALIGTTIAAFVALPVAMLAARNISPRPLQVVARLVLNFLRTVPSIIWGLFFVVIVGLGPFPGILALGCYAAGYLGKFYYEGIESIDPRPLLALETVGASAVQRFRYGVFPQVLPLLLGYTLYMFEYNLRAASILGVVGAGGVGFYIHTYVNNFQYDKAATALLLLLVAVTIIDAVSSKLRALLAD